jgi:polyribonucleotide nucleotidyltransferase
MLVVVKEIDRDAKKSSLAPANEGARAGDTVQKVAVAVGAVVRGAVERIETYGIFVQLEGKKGRAGRGLVPTEELVRAPRDRSAQGAPRTGQDAGVSRRVAARGPRQARLPDVGFRCCSP